MRGTIELPGDKSISHRLAMLAAIAEGSCHILNYNTGADCASTLACLQQLGTGVDLKGRGIHIEPGPLRSSDQPLDCGNSGSTIRMLTGLLAGQDVPAVLIGDVSLLRRPMRRIAEPLQQMGAIISLRDEEFPPVVLKQGVTRPIRFQMPVSSAQVKTAVLFASLRFPGTRVLEKDPSRDHTERLFEHLHISTDRGRPAIVRGFQYQVPGDVSSAAFFVLAALLRENSDLLIRNVLVNPYRVGYLRKIRQAGGRVDVVNQKLVQNELWGDIRVQSGGALRPIQIRSDEVPGLIDEIPALAILGTRCGLEVSGAIELRYKESDRIQAICSNLDSLGIHVEEWDEGFRVIPGKMKDGMAKSFGDHRIAMAFAAAGIEVDEPDCVKISSPEFFDILNGL